MVLVSSRSRRSSRRTVVFGLGAVIVAAVIVAVVALSGSSSHKPGASSGAFSGTGSESATKIRLSSPSGNPGIVGIAEIVRRNNTAAIAVLGKGLAPNSKRNAYAVWLYRSPTDAVRLGFVNPGIGRNGHLDTAGGLPANAASYSKILITTETTGNPTTPGPVVLEGPLRGA